MQRHPSLVYLLHYIVNNTQDYISECFCDQVSAYPHRLQSFSLNLRFLIPKTLKRPSKYWQIDAFVNTYAWFDLTLEKIWSMQYLEE